MVKDVPRVYCGRLLQVAHSSINTTYLHTAAGARYCRNMYICLPQIGYMSSRTNHLIGLSTVKTAGWSARSGGFLIGYIVSEVCLHLLHLPAPDIMLAEEQGVVQRCTSTSSLSGHSLIFDTH